MSNIRCNEPMCDEEVQVSCDCTSPVTYSCEKHLLKHFKSNVKPHRISLIFLKPVEGTKEALINFLNEEKHKNYTAKAKLIASFYQTFRSYENSLKEILKGIDSDSKKIKSYLEKVSRIEKLSKQEKDPVLCLLALQSYEAVEKANTIFTANHNIELFYEMGSQIDNVIWRMHKKKSKATTNEVFLNPKNSEDSNFERERNNIKLTLSEHKEAIRIDPNKDNSYNKIGDIFYEEKRYEKALKYCNYAIEINPNRAIYYINKGRTFRKLNKREEEIECFKEAMRIDPSSDACNKIQAVLYDEKLNEEKIKNLSNLIRIQPYNNAFYRLKGKALIQLNRIEEAEKCLKEFYINNPLCYDTNIDMGDALLCEKRYENALKYFNDAIEKNSYRACDANDYYRMKGKALIKLDRIEEAELNFKEAIKIAQNKDSECNEIGFLFAVERRYEEAIKYYNNAIRLKPNNKDYHANKVSALLKLGKIKEAIECFNEYIKTDPNNYCAYSHFQSLFYFAGRFEEALNCYNNVTRTNPEYIDYLDKGNILTGLGRIEEALECFKELFANTPNSGYEYNAIGNFFWVWERYEEAANYYNDSIRINPRYIRIYRFRGDSLAKLGRKEEAEDCFKEAIRIEPSDDSAYNDIGEYYCDEKRYEEAIKYFDHAIMIKSSNSLYYKNKGNALIKLSRIEEAEECFIRSIKLDYP